MGITIIVQRLGDDDDLLSGLIDIDEWLTMVEDDEDLRLRTEDTVARNPVSGQEIRVGPRPAESELRTAEGFVPFLVFSSGALCTRYRSEMDEPDDPVRRKIASVAQELDAVIAHDAGDGYLDW